MIRLAVVDDHPAIVAALEAAIRDRDDVELVGSATSVGAGLDLVERTAPDIVICDIARIDPDDVVDTYPDVPILGFTNHNDTAGLRRAHTAGFDHVVAKSALEQRAKELIDELSPSVE